MRIIVLLFTFLFTFSYTPPAFSQSSQFGNLKVFGNIQSTQNILNGYSAQVTSGGTTFILNTSPGQVYFTGTSAQTCILPVTNSLILGQSYLIVNNSTNTVTVQSSGANTLQAMAPNSQLYATVVSISGTGTASWSWTYYPQNSGSVTSVALSVPSFLSIAGSPITTSGTLAISLSGTALPIANGGTGQTAKAAAFDALQPMTTGGDLIYGGASGTGTRLANGSAGQILQSNGTTLAPTWVTNTAGAAAYNYTAQTSNYSATINDYVKASSASFAITLPTAIGVGGKGIWVQHDGTSLTQTYTINTTSAQTINVNGTAVASGGFVFQTQGEKALFISNGATWEMAEHLTQSSPTSWTPMFATKFTVTAANATAGATYTNNGQTFTVAATIAGATTLQSVGTGNPAASGTLTKASGTGDATITFSAFANSLGTVSSVTFWWQRRGNMMRIWGSLLPGTATSNLFMMSLPGPVALDTNFINPTNIITNPGMLVGTLQFTGGAAAIYNMVTATGGPTTLLYDANITSGTTQLTPQSTNGGISSGNLGSMWAEFPVSGWQP